jgi:phosphoribosyl-dephospho-CoA transferase
MSNRFDGCRRQVAYLDLPRHHLVWLSDRGWHLAAIGLPPPHQAICETWRQAERPLVVRRTDGDVTPSPLNQLDHLCLGLALPPDPLDGSKLRLALCVPIAPTALCVPPSVLVARVPLLLRQVASDDCVPQPWRAALRAFDAACSGFDFYVFGSLALQMVSGQNYLTADSDIDLLFCPKNQSQLRSGVALLERYAETLPLDGEIAFPGGQAVAWKEWSQMQRTDPAGSVLVKEKTRVHLMPMPHLLAALAATK